MTDKQKYDQATFTLTFGEQSENHRGMQINGNGLASSGFTIDELTTIGQRFVKLGAGIKLLRLDEPDCEMDPAAILLVKNGVGALLGKDTSADCMFEEQKSLPWDKKAFMYGRVVNKHARHNLCYGDDSQDPIYVDGKGRIIALKDVPFLSKLRERLVVIIGEKATDTQVEGNYYYDIKKCGIGFHGDSERKIVIGVRLGATIPLVYRWFHWNKPVSEPIPIDISHGDIYLMSEKATGNDWKLKKTKTLRHAAGSDKFTVYKLKN